MQQENNNMEEELLEDVEESIDEEAKKEEQQDYGHIIKELNCKIEEQESKYLRLQADFDNYKKRLTREKQDIYKFATEDLIKSLLPVIDNFERAITSIEENKEASEGYLKGVKMVFQQLIEVLKKEGLEEIKAIGENFDPNCHHAVQQAFLEDVEDNSIMEVFQKGYRLKDKVIRPSMVKVCIHS
jgi:molecular chaperone GrpE